MTTQLMWQRINAAAGSDFLVQSDATFSHGALVQAIRQWLAVFDAENVRPGDRIIVWTRSEAAACSAFLAALLDGVVPVLLTPDTPALRTRALSHSVEAVMVIADADRPAAEIPPAGSQLLLQDAPVARASFWQRSAVAMLPQVAVAPASRDPRLPLDADGLAYILFTSGTTASPAGVCLSRGNIFANLATLSAMFGHDARSRIFNDMILAHADGLVQGPLLAAYNGCALVRSGGFQIGRLESWLERVRTTRSTHVITVPTIWAMIDAYARHDDYFDAPECRALMSVAAKLPEELWQRIETRFRRPMFNQYGLTETVTSALYAGPHAAMGGFGTIGKPVDCMARVDPAASPSEGGELQLRGTNIFGGYWNDPARTEASFTPDGWFRTGDLAQRNDDGSFRFTGRLKTVIMSGGFLIRPDEIDEAMLRHPDIAESATVGVADAIFENVPMTAVVCKRPVDEAELADHARAHLEPQKVPKRILVVPAIPRGDAGKARVNAVRALLQGGPDTQIDVRDTREAILATAADVFRIDPERLSLHTAQGDVAGWDSFSQLSLLLAVEESLSVRIPVAQVAAIQTLGDIVRTVEALRQ